MPFSKTNAEYYWYRCQSQEWWQHREMLDSVLAFFEVKPDFDLDVMSKSQTLSGLTSKF